MASRDYSPGWGGSPTDAASVRKMLPDDAATRALGQDLAARLQPGDVLTFSGPVGAGKTTMIQGIAEGVGSEIRATSPSFVIVHQYPGDPPIVHVDLYRLTDPREVEDLGLEEMVEELGAVLAVEWPHAAFDGLWPQALRIHIDFHETGRTVSLTAGGALWERRLRSLAGDE